VALRRMAMQEHGQSKAVAVRSDQVPSLVKLTAQDIAIISENIRMAESLTMSVLEREIDYGQLPGTPAPGLFDPGASKIINGFNCYPDYRVLHHVEEDGLISMVVQSVLISRRNQQIVGTGIGAASTRETKYKYRWVLDPQNYGYTPEQIKTLKTKDKQVRGQPTKEYRIENPEYGELVNTITKMAAKRADVDAAQSLPGVSSALRKIFTGRKPMGAQGGPAWNRFWSQVAALGLVREKVHEILKVKSMNDWISAGKSLNDAIEILSKWVVENAPPVPETAGPEEPLQDEDLPFPEEEATPPAPKPAPTRDPKTVTTINELFKACNEDFTVTGDEGKPRKMQPADVVKELGYSTQADIAESPSECYIKIRAIMTQ
jgi:hypothetical protein